METLLLLGVLLAINSPVVAQAVTEAGPWLTLVNLGVGGIFLWAFTTGRVHSDKELQRVITTGDTEAKRLVAKLELVEGELRERNREAVETLVPTLTKAMLMFTQVLDRTPPPKGRQ